MLANLAKVAILVKFRQVVDEMIRANKLTQLEGPHKVDENSKIGESGNFSRILPIAKGIGEMIRANKLTQLEGP